MAVPVEITPFPADGQTFDGLVGAAKVAARYVYALLTPRGSVPGRPADGSPLLKLSRNFRSDYDLLLAYQTSAGYASTTVRGYEAATDPASERFGAAVLVGITVAPGVVTYTLGVAAADGSKILAPLDLNLEL